MRDDLISVAEAAKRLGISRAILYAKVRTRSVPHFRIGDRVLFDLAELLSSLRVESEASSRPTIAVPKQRSQISR